MANQMVALQARAPQGGGLGPAIAQGAQMINMMAQQRAAERQAAQAQQAMDIQAAQEARAATIAGPQLEKAKADALAASLDANAKQAQLVKRDLGVIQSGDFNAISNWRQRATQLLPEWADILPSAEQIASDRNTQLMIAATVEQIINKEIASPVATLQLTPQNQAVSVTVGGMRPGGELLNIGREGSAPAPRATPTTPMGGPVEETAAPMGGGDTRSLSQVISSALETGVMAKTDFDKLLSIAQPESRAKIADWVRSNNIEVMDAPGEMRVSPMSYDGQTPQSEFAVLRGEPMQSRTASLRDAPTMQQTMAQSGGRPLIIKTPTPPGANVPIERVRAEGAAGRESPAEAAAKARAVAQANAAIETEKKAAEKLPGRRQVSTIIGKIRNAYEQLEKRQAIASEKRGGFANVVDYIATSSPGREVQKALGTSSSKYLSEIVNSRKLLATAIKNATGMSAQEMNSNIELQLTLDALTDPTQGIEAARSTLDTLEELYGAPRTAPPQGPRKTPTKGPKAKPGSGWGKAEVVGD